MIGTVRLLHNSPLSLKFHHRHRVLFSNVNVRPPLTMESTRLWRMLNVPAATLVALKQTTVATIVCFIRFHDVSRSRHEA